MEERKETKSQARGPQLENGGPTIYPGLPELKDQLPLSICNPQL